MTRVPSLQKYDMSCFAVLGAGELDDGTGFNCFETKCEALSAYVKTL